MAPRKPERTASMREREAQLEIARKRNGGDRSSEAGDTISICSSNGDKVSTGQPALCPGSHQHNHQHQQQPRSHSQVSSSSMDLFHGSNTASSPGTFDKSQKYDMRPTMSSKLEIFDGAQPPRSGAVNENRSNILKDSVRKITHTIDSYLKDKQIHDSNMYDMMKDTSAMATATSNHSANAKLPPPAPPSRSGDLAMSAAHQQTASRPRRNQLFSSDSMSIASYTRSEYLPANSRSYGFHNSIGNSSHKSLTMSFYPRHDPFVES